MFASVAAAEAAINAEKLRPLFLGEFDRRWESQVTRTRDILDIIDQQ